MTDDNPDLQAALLAAHGAGDRAALIRLYTDAADLTEAAGDDGRAAFFLTHAWVFALEAGAPEAALLRQRLKESGRV